MIIGQSVHPRDNGVAITILAPVPRHLVLVRGRVASGRAAGAFAVAMTGGNRTIRSLA